MGIENIRSGNSLDRLPPPPPPAAAPPPPPPETPSTKERHGEQEAPVATERGEGHLDSPNKEGKNLDTRQTEPTPVYPLPATTAPTPQTNKPQTL